MVESGRVEGSSLRANQSETQSDTQLPYMRRRGRGERPQICMRHTERESEGGVSCKDLTQNPHFHWELNLWSGF